MIKDLLREFKKFTMRGNAIDLAVGVIIGAAFGKIVDSLVQDLLMPPLGLLIGKVDLANFFVVLRDGSVASPYASLAAAQQAGAVTMNVGMFVNALISFVIVAFAVFVLIKTINELQQKIMKQEENIKNETTKKCPFCCEEIDIKAVRCPHCTSDLAQRKEKNVLRVKSKA